MRKSTIAIFALLLVGVAVAQDASATDVDLLNPATWFVSTAALATFIATVLAFVRKHILKTLDGPGVIGASVGLGVVLGLLGHGLGFLEGGVVASLIFGVTSGLAASGGIDLLRGVLGTGGGNDDDATPPATGTLPG